MLLGLFFFILGCHLPGHIDPRMLLCVLPCTLLPTVFEFRGVGCLIRILQNRFGAKGILLRARWCGLRSWWVRLIRVGLAI